MQNALKVWALLSVAMLAAGSTRTARADPSPPYRAALEAVASSTLDPVAVAAGEGAPFAGVLLPPPFADLAEVAVAEVETLEGQLAACERRAVAGVDVVAARVPDCDPCPAPPSPWPDRLLWAGGGAAVGLVVGLVVGFVGG